MYRLHLSYRQQPTGPWGAQANTLSLLSLASRERRYVPLSEPEPIAPAEALPDLETEDRRSLRHSLHAPTKRDGCSLCLRPRLIDAPNASCPCHSVLFSSKLAVFLSPAGLDCWTLPVQGQLVGGVLSVPYLSFMARTGLNSVLSHRRYAGPVRVMDGGGRCMNATKIHIYVYFYYS